MNRRIFENYIGKQVELFVAPDMPKVSGVLEVFDEDFFVIGDEIWSYKAILGIRPIKTKNGLKKQKIQKEPEEEPTEEPAEKKVEQPARPNQAQKAAKQPQTADTEASVLPDTPSEEVPVIPAEDSKSVEPSATPVETAADIPSVDEKTPIVIPNREFTGVLTSFNYEHKRWGFIESDEVKKAGIPLRDGERVFVHLNQITDEALRAKLLTEKPKNPNIDVAFKLTNNTKGVAADNVKEVIHVKISDVVNPITAAAESTAKTEPTENDKAEDAVKDEKNELASEPETAQPEVPKQAADSFADIEEPKEEGEIDYYRRYDNLPNGEIRMKGNKLFRFEDTDVIDPVLAVFLEVSPSAEGQQVKFVKRMGAKGKMRATKIEAAVPFPEEKIKEWEGLIEKAKLRMKDA